MRVLSGALRTWRYVQDLEKIQHGQGPFDWSRSSAWAAWGFPRFHERQFHYIVHILVGETNEYGKPSGIDISEMNLDFL